MKKLLLSLIVTTSIFAMEGWEDCKVYAPLTSYVKDSDYNFYLDKENGKYYGARKGDHNYLMLGSYDHIKDLTRKKDNHYKHLNIILEKKTLFSGYVREIAKDLKHKIDEKQYDKIKTLNADIREAIDKAKQMHITEILTEKIQAIENAKCNNLRNIS